MNRADHLTWCKSRALVLLDEGQLQEAFNSLASDLSKHGETAEHPGIQLGLGLLMIGDLRTVPQMRKFIEGFN